MIPDMKELDDVDTWIHSSQYHAHLFESWNKSLEFAADFLKDLNGLYQNTIKNY